MDAFQPKKKLFTPRKILIGLGAVILVCILCAVIVNLLPSAPSTPTANGQPSKVSQAQENTLEPTAPPPTNPPKPTDTPEPTKPPRPTFTPRPTNTPVPTSTPTPVPQPIVLTGKGDGVADVDKWNGLTLIHIIGPNVHDNFVVYNYDAAGEKIDLLVNTIGAYDGYQIIDLYDDEDTVRFQVESSGDWTIEVYPFAPEYVHTLQIPGSYTGKGDDVFVFTGPEVPDLAKVTTDSNRANFVIFSIGSDRDLLVNEIAPYDGTIVIPADSLMLVVQSENEWTIEVTVR